MSDYFAQVREHEASHAAAAVINGDVPSAFYVTPDRGGAVQFKRWKGDPRVILQIVLASEDGGCHSEGDRKQLAILERYFGDEWEQVVWEARLRRASIDYIAYKVGFQVALEMQWYLGPADVAAVVLKTMQDLERLSEPTALDAELAGIR
jgi:hypothetical protein